MDSKYYKLNLYIKQFQIDCNKKLDYVIFNLPVVYILV